MSVDHRHASPVHGVNKAVDKGHWNLVPQVLYWIQIRTEDRPWHDSDDVLLESPWWLWQCGRGPCPLEHVVLVTAKIGSNDLIDIPQSRDAIISTWANIPKDNRSSFMIDPEHFPNHDALPTP